MPTPRKSDEFREVTSTRSHCPESEALFPASRPKMPAGLPPAAEAEWKRIVPKLCRRKTLTKADSSCLEIYVRMWARYLKVADSAQENPLTELGEESAASKIASRLESNLKNLLKELSATPASRRHTKPPKEEPKSPADELPSREETVLPEPEIRLEDIQLDDDQFGAHESDEAQIARAEAEAARILSEDECQ